MDDYEQRTSGKKAKAVIRKVKTTMATFCFMFIYVEV